MKERCYEKLDTLQKLLSINSKEKRIIESIAKTRSITKSAQDLGLSYKTVWNHIVNINNALGKKIIETRKGGKGGSNAYLTKAGEEFLNALENLGKSLDRLLSFVSGEDSEEILRKFAKRFFVKTSARNQIPVKITKVKMDKINAQIYAKTDKNEQLTSIITSDSVNSLGIKRGMDAYFLIKASWVTLGVSVSANEDLNGSENLKLSARNILQSIIKEVIKGNLNSEVILETEKGTQLIATITNDSVEKLNLAAGKKVNAIFKASHVIVGI